MLGGSFSGQKVAKALYLRMFLSLLELSRLFSQSSGNGGRSAARTHPSTRAGGQDYGSFNKLPQIIQYTLYIIHYIEYIIYIMYYILYMIHYI